MSLEARLGYHFSDPRLLQEALTHPSCNQSTAQTPFNYQRLEFLGDAILGAAVASLLYRLYPKDSEGALARRYAALVRTETLASIAKDLALGQSMHVGNSEEQNQGRDNLSNLEDVCEAIIGALYLDGGWQAATRFVEHHWNTLARHVQEPPTDAKTALQEWLQAQGLPLPVYSTIATEGSAHAPQFTVQVTTANGLTGVGKAGNKRQAEQFAAQDCLNKAQEK